MKHEYRQQAYDKIKRNDRDQAQVKAYAQIDEAWVYGFEFAKIMRRSMEKNQSCGHAGAQRGIQITRYVGFESSPQKIVAYEKLI